MRNSFDFESNCISLLKHFLDQVTSPKPNVETCQNTPNKIKYDHRFNLITKIACKTKKLISLNNIIW